MLLEMTDKKPWFSKIYNDSQEKRPKLDISWSESDSEEDPQEPLVQKRMRMSEYLQQTKNNHWLNLKLTPPNDRLQVEDHKVQTSHEAFLESPVISCTEDQSPVLSQAYVSLLQEKKSPVIGRNSVVRRLKWRCRLKNKAKHRIILDETVHSLSQSTLIVESPTESSPDISPAKSEPSQPYKIEPFPSQHSSEVVSDSLSSCSDPNLVLCNHSARKRRLKKGTLASQLQSALDLQNSSVSIWQHEVFLDKARGETHRSHVSDGVHFAFSVRKKWQECGCTVLESQTHGDAETLFAGFGKEIDNFNSFLLITSPTNASNVRFESDKSYQIFPPYSAKVVNFQLKKTLCIINASRFISL